ncbi:MAG: hypothetical protein ACOC2F_04790 [Bacteroidota bacterium]
MDFDSDTKYAVTTEDGGETWSYLDLTIPDNIMFANNHSIEKIFAYDNVIFILGDDKKIYKSTDLFKIWETYYVPIEIKKASFINSEIAYVSDNITIYKTSNGGKNWKMLSTPEDPVVFNHFFDETNGFSIHYNTEYPPMGDFPQAVSTKIYFTKDGGSTWQSEEHPEVISGYKSFPTNNIVYYVSEENTYVLKLK